MDKDGWRGFKKREKCLRRKGGEKGIGGRERGMEGEEGGVSGKGIS